MLLPQQVHPGYFGQIMDILKSPIRPKHIRLSAVLICINQFLIANILLFIVILAYIHIEEANSRAIADMEDQREDAYYSLQDLILNRIRFNFANNVTMTSRVFAVGLVCCSAVYLLSAIGLLVGIHKSREEFVFVWLFLQVVFFIVGIFCAVWISDGPFVKHTVGKLCFYFMSAAVLVCDATMWYIIYCFYHSIRLMNKLREIATVAIPCPAPGAVWTHYKANLKRKLAANKKNFQATGGGPSAEISLSPLEQSTVELVSMQSQVNPRGSAMGLQMGEDSDAAESTIDIEEPSPVVRCTTQQLPASRKRTENSVENDRLEILRMQAKNQEELMKTLKGIEKNSYKNYEINKKMYELKKKKADLQMQLIKAKLELTNMRMQQM